MKRITLNNVPVGKTAIILQVNSNNPLQKNRLTDVGIIKNSCITPLFVSPGGDPTAYLVKNSLIALRNEDTENINVTYK